MLNWWLILLIVILPILCIALVIYLIFYYQSEEDKGTDYVPKAVAGLGFLIAIGTVLLVPYDVANSPDPTVKNTYNQTLNTMLMWEIVLWMMAVMAVVICPFFMFFYDAYDPDKPRVGKQVVHAVVMTLVIFGIFALITGICFWKVGVALIPFQNYQGTPQLTPVTSESLSYVGGGTSETLVLNVTFTSYCMGMLCFFGWILFFFYGGVGIIAYPITLIRGFLKRTKAISTSRFTQEMAVVLAKADALLELSVALQKEARGVIARGTKNKINIIRNEVYFLEAQQDQLIWAYTKAGGSPFIVYGKLALGIICLVTSIMWCLQIFVYNTFNADPLLNTLLIKLNNAFALCAICAYGVFAFYLMWATLQGQIALGLRLVFFQIHPMKKHDTLVNSFLFNASLLLLTSYAVLQFVTRSFQDYAPLTSINALMTLYVMNLKGIGVFIKWAQFCFLGMTLLGAVWIAACSKKKRRDPTKLRMEDLR